MISNNAHRFSNLVFYESCDRLPVADGHGAVFGDRTNLTVPFFLVFKQLSDIRMLASHEAY